MRRKFLTNLILLVFLNFLVKPFWVFGIDMSVQNTVGPSEYGFYFTIFNFAFIFQILLDMGITNFNNRNIAQNNHLLSKHFSSIIILRFLFAVVYMIVILGLGKWMGYNSKQMYFLLIIGFNQFLLSLILYLRSNISALLLFKVDSFISVFDRILMIIICAILLWGNVTKGEFQISWFIYAQTISYLLTALLAFGILSKRMNFKRLNWNPAFFLMIIKKSLPYATLILLMGMYSRIDTVLIERLLPNGELQSGIYASAFRLLDVANNMSGVLFAVLLLPLFSKMINAKEDLSKLVKLGFTLLFILSSAVAITSYFYGQQIMYMLYDQHSSETALDFSQRMLETASIFKLMMIVYVFTSTTYIFGTLLTANGSLKQLNIIALLGVVISLIVNFTFIPQFQAVGSAWASLSAQAVTAILQLGLAFYILPIYFDKKYIFRLFSYFIIIAILSWLSVQIPYIWFYKLALLIVSIIGTAFVLRLLDIKSFISIIKNEE